MKKVRNIFIDFINYAFLLSVIGFVIIYLIAGNRLMIVSKIMEATFPLLIFMCLFFLLANENSKKIKKFKKENSLDEIIAYFDRSDVLKDYIAILLVCTMFAVLALVDGSINIIDITQLLVAVAISLTAHFFLLRKKETLPQQYYATRLNKVIDELIIYFLPVAIIGVCALELAFNIFDIVQAALSFLIIFLWRKFLFRRSK